MSLESELIEKLEMLDSQLEKQAEFYEILKNQTSWDSDTEEQIFDRIDEIQAAKTRLITGEKLPEVVYRDREVIKEVPKTVYQDKVVEVKTVEYIEREIKNINIYKSSFALAALYFSLLSYTAIAAAIYFGYLRFFINLKGG